MAINILAIIILVYPILFIFLLNRQRAHSSQLSGRGRLPSRQVRVEGGRRGPRPLLLGATGRPGKNTNKNPTSLQSVNFLLRLETSASYHRSGRQTGTFETEVLSQFPDKSFVAFMAFFLKLKLSSFDWAFWILHSANCHDYKMVLVLGIEHLKAVNSDQN